jgi:hypothetical protein
MYTNKKEGRGPLMLIIQIFTLLGMTGFNLRGGSL